jgi:hypothetical protein
MAGGELRLGMLSIYMETCIAQLTILVKIIIYIYMGTYYTRQKRLSRKHLNRIALFNHLLLKGTSA